MTSTCRRIAPWLLMAICCFVSARAGAQILPRFEIATFCCGCTSSNQNFCQQHFEKLNYRRFPGHYFAMGSDARRAEVEANNNALAVYHNDLNTLYTQKTPGQKAGEIHQYVLDRFTGHGSPPDWVILNELSAGLWPDTPAYRTWVIDVCTSLSVNLGYNVVVASPFHAPGANSADWQKLAAHAWIGAEVYLSGEEVMNNGNSVSWCQSQYQTSRNAYLARGVPATKLFLFEHFAMTNAGTGWGRAGIPAADWHSVIRTRSAAIRNVGFAGFCSYAWGSNPMGAPESEVLAFMDTHASEQLPFAYATRAGGWELYP